MYLQNERLYLYVFLDLSFTREKVTDFLNTQAEVRDWFFSTPNTIFIRTTLSAQGLSQLLEQKFGEHRHLVAQMSGERWGRLPKDHWDHFP